MLQWIRNLLGRGDLPKGEPIPMAVGMQAKRLGDQGNLRGAVAVYAKFLADHPGSAHGFNNAAGFLLQLGDGLKAQEYLERALRIDPEYEAALCNLAEAKRMLKDLVEARNIFEQVLRDHPRSVTARMGLGSLFMELKNGQMACEHLAEAVRLEPRNPAAWHNLGAARIMAGNLDGAEAAFRQVLAVDSQSERGRQGLQHVQDMRQMAAKARKMGAVLTVGDTVVSGKSRALVCHVCGKKYTDHGQVAMRQRSMGGALCRHCGKFYCEPCVARTVFGEGRTMQCECGKARAPLGGDGSLRFEGFDELVVFPVT
jgi:tetratricopeptide (TPR) repeat protein